MGLKIAIDSHSNIASPATVSSDGNAFQVYIGDPGEFPFLMPIGPARAPPVVVARIEEVAKAPNITGVKRAMNRSVEQIV